MSARVFMRSVRSRVSWACSRARVRCCTRFSRDSRATCRSRMAWNWRSSSSTTMTRKRLKVPRVTATGSQIDWAAAPLEVEAWQGGPHGLGGPGREALEERDRAGQEDPLLCLHHRRQPRQGPGGEGREPGQGRGAEPAQRAPDPARVVRGHEDQAAAQEGHVQVGHEDPHTHVPARRAQGALRPHHPQEEDQRGREDQPVQCAAQERAASLPAPREAEDAHQHQDARDQGEDTGDGRGPGGHDLLQAQQGHQQVRQLQHRRGSQQGPGPLLLPAAPPGPEGQAGRGQPLQQQVAQGPGPGPSHGRGRQVDQGHHAPGAHQHRSREAAPGQGAAAAAGRQGAQGGGSSQPLGGVGGPGQGDS